MGYFWRNLDWDVRYPPNWLQLRSAAHKLTGGVCCYCCSATSTTVHHTQYWWVKDTPGVNIFPLCNRCHRLAHSPKNWIKHPGNPLWKNRNTIEWEAKLRQGFKKLKNKK